MHADLRPRAPQYISAFGLAVALTACAIGCSTSVPEKGPSSEMVSVGEMIVQANGAPVTIDLRRDGVVYHAEHGINLTGVALVCPNNQQMLFSAWVDAQSRDFDVNYTQLEDGFSVVKGEVNSGYGAKNSGFADGIVCPTGCRPCSDGGCICNDI
jgi:hypothetical protein